jgi:hypothetical protein
VSGTLASGRGSGVEMGLGKDSPSPRAAVSPWAHLCMAVLKETSGSNSSGWKLPLS